METEAATIVKEALTDPTIYPTSPKESRGYAIKEYRKTFNLNSHGMFIHVTNLIRGRLCYFLFSTPSITDLDVLIHPQEFPAFAFHAKSLRGLKVYPWKINDVNQDGDQIFPATYSSPDFNDRLAITVSGGQEGTEVTMVIRYV